MRVQNISKQNFKGAMWVDNGLKTNAPYYDNTATEKLADILSLEKTSPVRLIESVWKDSASLYQPKLILVDDAVGKDATALIELEKNWEKEKNAVKKRKSIELKLMLPVKTRKFIQDEHKAHKAEIKAIKAEHGKGWKDYIDRNRSYLNDYSYKRNLERAFEMLLEKKFAKAYSALYVSASERAKEFSIKEFKDLMISKTGRIKV